MTTREERARGTLWGQAVGDALGTTVEFSSEAAIARHAASQWPAEIVGGGPFHVLPGQITDDTELALALARQVVRDGEWKAWPVREAYVRWRESGPFDVGNATEAAFGRQTLGPSQTTQANGSMMRASPMGIFGAAMALPALAALAESDSRLSHPHEVPVAACAVFVTTIAEAITSGLDGATLFAHALERAAGSPIEDTLRAARTGLPVSDESNQGWVRIALQHAFFHLLHATDFERAVIATVRKGGDTDTNAAIVGALLGARFGVEAIPLRWRETVRTCRSPRPAEFHCGDLDALALALITAGDRSES